MVGAEVSVNDAVQRLGSRSPQQLEARRDRVDMRRILVSREAHVSRSLGELDLARQFNAPITRGRRAMAEVGRFVGDSERELAEIDYVALALGVSLGLSLALVPLPIAGTSLRLGAAGGPLLVALFLGRLGRTGRLVWSLPCEAKTTCACSPAARSGEATLRCAQPAPSRAQVGSVEQRLDMSSSRSPASARPALSHQTFPASREKSPAPGQSLSKEGHPMPSETRPRLMNLPFMARSTLARERSSTSTAANGASSRASNPPTNILAKGPNARSDRDATR